MNWMVILPTLLRYGVVGVGVALATWYAITTWHRAQDADRLQAQIDQMKIQQQAQKEFDAKVDQVRQTIETKMNDFNANLAKMGEARRERIIERIPANTVVCLDAGTVGLLNEGDAAAPGTGANTSARSYGASDNFYIPALP